jgi:organic radical activating enzyme
LIIKGLLDEDFVNYRKPSMFISFPYCSFKCDKEFGKNLCQNSSLAKSPNIEVNIEKIVDRFTSNDITKAIVLGGLEPLDSFESVTDIIKSVRGRGCLDDVVIYTGYTEEESIEYINKLKQFENIIVKFGRYIPNQEKHYDEVLGVYLISDNQYAKRIS